MIMIVIVFLQMVLKVKVTVPWKLHMVCSHLEPLLTRLGRGLGVVCEQAGEAVHCKFKKTKARFKRNHYHTSHGKAKKTAVVHWSSWNVHPLNKSMLQMYREKARMRRRH